MNILVPSRGGYYWPIGARNEPTIDKDMPYLLDADSHHHTDGPCTTWCPRSEVVIRTITDDGSPA